MAPILIDGGGTYRPPSTKASTKALPSPNPVGKSSTTTTTASREGPSSVHDSRQASSKSSAKPSATASASLLDRLPEDDRRAIVQARAGHQEVGAGGSTTPKPAPGEKPAPASSDKPRPIPADKPKPTPAPGTSPTALGYEEFVARHDEATGQLDVALNARGDSAGQIQELVDDVNAARLTEWREFRRDHPHMLDPDVANRPTMLTVDQFVAAAQAEVEAPGERKGGGKGPIQGRLGSTGKPTTPPASPTAGNGLVTGGRARGRTGGRLDGASPTIEINTSSDATTIDELLAENSNWLSAADRRALTAAYDGYRSAERDVRAAEEVVYDLEKDNVAHATRFGRDRLEEVQGYYTARGVTEEDGNDRIQVDTWDDPTLANAFYSPGTDSMRFGRLGGVPLAMSADVIAHEYTHRIFHELVPKGDSDHDGQSAAINESLSDTVASAMDSDWVVGEDARSGGVRDMAAPDITISDYDARTDHEEHLDADVPNAAAWRIGTAVGRERMGDIYINAMERYLPNHDLQFSDLATATYRSAVDLYGAGSSEAQAVRDAWDTVLELDGADGLFRMPGGPRNVR